MEATGSPLLLTGVYVSCSLLRGKALSCSC
jgi:hypothetical protein